MDSISLEIRQRAITSFVYDGILFARVGDAAGFNFEHNGNYYGNWIRVEINKDKTPDFDVDVWNVLYQNALETKKDLT